MPTSIGNHIEKIRTIHLVAVGRVTTDWARLEHDMAVMLWFLMDVENKIGACLTSQIPNAARLLDAMSALAGLRGADETLLKSIRKFAEQTYSLGEKRNRIVHGVWTFDPEGPTH